MRQVDDEGAIVDYDDVGMMPWADVNSLSRRLPVGGFPRHSGADNGLFDGIVAEPSAQEPNRLLGFTAELTG